MQDCQHRYTWYDAEGHQMSTAHLATVCSVANESFQVAATKDWMRSEWLDAYYKNIKDSLTWLAKIALRTWICTWAPLEKMTLSQYN